MEDMTQKEDGYYDSSQAFILHVVLYSLLLLSSIH